ncbi:MAG: DUF2318 domain-containing protein [Nitrospirota bacterium]|nr:DUF2318 domain-containing protein [Nitrospirota bacterium]
MSRFVLEALFIGAKEGVKLSFCTLLVFSLLSGRERLPLKRSVIAGLLVVFLASFLLLTLPVTFEMREIIVRMIGYVFGIFFFLSIGALFHESGTDIIGPFRSVGGKRVLQIPILLVLTIGYFAPDMAGSALFIADLASMAQAPMPVFLASGLGFVLFIAGTAALGRKVQPVFPRLFGLPQVLLTLALIKLLAGGIRGFAELTLIPAVQAGLMKLVHDVIHQTFVMILVPDHPVLSTTTWNFVGFLFRETAGLWLSLILLVTPLVLFVIKHFREPLRYPGSIDRPSQRRMFIRSIRDQRLLKSLPVLFFLAVIIMTWFSQQDAPGVSLYLPDPKPVAADGDALNIPIQSPTEDLRDGAIHKFSLLIRDEQVRLLIMKKPDGTLTACLDACEICPPDGYGQSREHVVCLYCKTPIPFDTVGKPGGCNPIPLPTVVTDKEVRLTMKDISEKWVLVKSGASKTTVK